MTALDPVRVLRRRAHAAGLDGRGPRDPGAVARRLVALHGTDPATVHLSVWARHPRPLVDVADDVRRALEVDHTLVRVMCMRRTVHVLDPELAACGFAHAADRLVKPQRKLADEILAAGGLAGRFDLLADAVDRALADGDLSVDELQRLVPELATKVVLQEGKAYEGTAPVGRYLLEALGSAGRIVRARNLGSWRNARNTWGRRDRVLAGHPPVPGAAEAYAKLVRQWLAVFAPGTRDDLAWWLGIPKGAVGRALEALGDELVEVEVAGWPGPRFALRSHLAGLREDAGPHGVALLPALDPSAMACQQRAAFLDPAFVPQLVDRSGNVGQTVWVDGRVVGGWAVRPDGEVVFRLLAEGVDPEPVAAACARLQTDLGGEAPAARFPVPLSKALVQTR